MMKFIYLAGPGEDFSASAAFSKEKTPKRIPEPPNKSLTRTARDIKSGLLIWD